MKISSQYISINNSRQNILTMGTDDSNPVLLIIHGGAGSPDRPLVQKYNSELANYYNVVCWDQRGAGLSFTDDIKLTIDIMLDDLKAVVQYLRVIYKQDKVFIAGHSWGAYLGVRFASMYPEYLQYYIGTGQGISSHVDEEDKYNFVMKYASKRNDEKVILKLKFFGVPHGYYYENNDSEAKKFVSKMIHKYGGYIHDNNNFSMKTYLSLYIKYYKHNIIKVIKGMVKSASLLNEEMDKEDKISCITDLKVPVLLISGEGDAVCPVAATQRWFNALSAPKKDFVKVNNASHMVNFEQADIWNESVIRLLDNI